MHPLFHILIKRELKAKLWKNRKKKKDLTFFTGDAFFSLYFYVLVSKFF